MANSMRDMAEVYQKYINLKEPRSNRGLEQFRSKEEIEAEKKEAKEKALLKAQ